MATVSLQILSDFQKYFNGNDQAHGCHVYGDKVNDKGKREGKSWAENKPPLEKDYQDHLNGVKGLGVAPIKHSNKVSFCVIDVDDYSSKTDRYVHLIHSNNMPLVPFRSKSGGLHLYIFFQQEVTASFAIGIMRKFLSALSLPKGTEIFPKQHKLKKEDTGSWINLPYYNRGNAFKGVMKNGIENALGTILEIEQALVEIKTKLQTKETLEEFFNNLPLQDAPPCLQSIYLLGTTVHRNDYLFNLACYYKSKVGDDFEYKLMEANSMLDDPLPVKEVSATVARNKSKSYSYKCTQEPICSYCNKGECIKREFGIEGDRISQLNFEDFIQYKTEPPYYVWRIDGKDLKFFKESDIINQAKFRELCMRELHALPNRLRDNAWTKIVNDALKQVILKEVAPEDDISPGAQFFEYLVEFFTKRAYAQSKSQVIQDRVFKDDELGCYVFKSKDLVNFIIRIKTFYYYGQTEIQDKLRTLKGVPKRYHVGGEQGTIRAWLLPYKSLESFVEEITIKDFEVDFSETYNDKPY